MNNDNTDNLDQSCDSCGYSLAGLPLGSQCPECGHTSARRSKNIRETTMSFQAPTSYIKWVRYGFLLCMFALIGGLAGPAAAGFSAGTKSMIVPLAFAIFVLASGCWTAGVWMITRPRKNMNSVSHDNVLDNETLVKVIRISAFAWPSWIMLIVAAAMISQTGSVSMIHRFAIASVGLIAWVALIPVCVYFAELAYWAADDRLATRLRGTAWVMMVFGVLAVISRLLSMTSLPISDPAKFVHIWTTIFSFGATIVLFWSMFRMSMVLNWALSHQRISAEKHIRLARRIENQMNHQSSISAQTDCHTCGYNLEGLAFTGVCPECGDPYGQPEGIMGIRDPALDAPRHDDTPIQMADSSGSEVTHRSGLDSPISDSPPVAPPSHEYDEHRDSIPLVDDSDRFDQDQQKMQG
jgi:predicted RNA-binding Zn-ribbon protein involved in translation (DUF1610 family)